MSEEDITQSVARLNYDDFKETIKNYFKSLHIDSFFCEGFSDDFSPHKSIEGSLVFCSGEEWRRYIPIYIFESAFYEENTFAVSFVIDGVITTETLPLKDSDKFLSDSIRKYRDDLEKRTSVVDGIEDNKSLVREYIESLYGLERDKMREETPQEKILKEHQRRWDEKNS